MNEFALADSVCLVDSIEWVLQTPQSESGVQGMLLEAAPDETGSRCAMQVQDANPTLPPQR